MYNKSAIFFQFFFQKHSAMEIPKYLVILVQTRKVGNKESTDLNIFLLIYNMLLSVKKFTEIFLTLLNNIIFEFNYTFDKTSDECNLPVSFQ